MATKSKAKAKTDTKTIGGKRFTKEACSTKKTDANKKAASIRAAGNTARVVKNGSVHCVYKGPRSKAKRGRRKAA